MDRSVFDLQMMRRCIELSAAAVQQRELPFACVICRDGEIVTETINRVVRDGDVTRHAEVLAISEAQRILGRSDLSDCTVYSNVPCPMCAFPIRESRIGRVVYAISSPMMGGLSKWNVLGDNEISNVMPEVFGDAPEVAAGLHYREAAAVWRRWNPVFWLGIRFRGCLADPAKDDAYLTLQVRRHNRRPLRRLLVFLSQAMARKRTAAAQSDLPS
jgi:tRNA(adenine34) deaminase